MRGSLTDNRLPVEVAVKDDIGADRGTPQDSSTGTAILRHLCFGDSVWLQSDGRRRAAADSTAEEHGRMHVPDPDFVEREVAGTKTSRAQTQPAVVGRPGGTS